MRSKLITALVTPFDEYNNVDKEELIKLIKDVERQGSEGLVVGGTTGEGTSLSEEELIDVIKIVNEHSKSEIIINVGSNSTFKTINLINKIKDYKHDALMIIVPYYNKPNKKGIYEHFKCIANAFKEEKFILYNVPSRTIVKLEEDTETEDASPALTIFLKRDTNVESDRIARNRSTEITGDKMYVVALTNETKVIVAKMKETATV